MYSESVVKRKRWLVLDPYRLGVSWRFAAEESRKQAVDLGQVVFRPKLAETFGLQFLLFLVENMQFALQAEVFGEL